MRHLKLLLIGIFTLLCTANSYAIIVNGIRQMPEFDTTTLKGFTVSDNTDDFYYLYNINAKAFYCNGNDYNTQSSVSSNYGLGVIFIADGDYSDTYRWYDNYQGWWRMTFIENTTTMYVDYNNQANYRFGIEKTGNKSFRIFASPNGNPGWRNWQTGGNYVQEGGHYVGIDANAQNTVVYPFLDPSNQSYIEWGLVNPDDYDAFNNKLEIYYFAEHLRALIEEAEGYGLDVSSEKNVYLNENASYNDIYYATDSVNAKIIDWKNNQSANATLANPYDMTFKIENPNFEGNNILTGWLGTAFGYASPRENAEHYNKTYDTYQVISDLPAGIYAVGVKAFYRAGDANNAYTNYRAANNESRYAKLYASSGNTNNEESIMSSWSPENENRAYVGSESQYYDNSLKKTFYCPNDMIAAEHYMHSLGFYDNTVLIPVDDSGELIIGVRKDYTNDSDWSIFDDFSLTYYGNGKDAKDYYNSVYVAVTQLTLNTSKTTLTVGETTQITATIRPTNAKNKVLNWTSSNPQVATVDQTGLVTACGAGKATISATTTDGSNITKSITITAVSSTIAVGDLAINEIMASNIDEFVSPAYNYDGWIEIYNTSAKSISLVGLFVSDDATNLRKWQMPVEAGSVSAHGFKTIWFDSNNIAVKNAPFKLDTDGGTIYISNSDGTLLASQTYPASMERISYARKTDGTGEWGNAFKATPGATNATSTFATTQLSAPVVDQPSQLFTSPLSINVTVPDGCWLAFTTDGSVPTMEGPVVNKGQFGCSTTTVYRFRLFAEGKLPSPVVTRSYIFRDKDYYLPIVSVVGQDRDLYGQEMGVLVQGSGNGRPGNGQSQACNWNMDWERPVNFSYIDANGEMVLNQDVDLEMCGGWSRAWSPHAFKLKGSKELGGNKNLPYSFFEEKPYIRNRTLQIRNGGNDTQARFRDPALQQIVHTSGIDIDYQSYQPVHEFINGRYIGVLNVREPNNKHYVYANYGWGDDEIDQFEMSPDSGYVQKCGTPDVYNQLVDILSPDAANSETYKEICSMVDIDEYANYMAAQLYLGNWDWPQNNVKAFRHRDGGKFRFVMFDLDGSFNSDDPINLFMGKEQYTFDKLYPTSLGRISAQIRFVTLFKNLLQNSDFRRRFIDAYSIMGGSVFEAERAISVINQLQERVQSAMNADGVGSALNSTADGIRNNLKARLTKATNALKNYWTFGLSDNDMRRVNMSSDVEGAFIQVNDAIIPTNSFNGYLVAPAKLKAIAPAGYEFKGWLSPSLNTQTILSNGSQWSYYDKGSLDGVNWQSPSYGESGWKSGNAPLGYNNPNITAATQVDYETQKAVFYFRTKVNLTQAPAADATFSLDYYADDGFVVYVNGTEAGRYNMPDGTPSYDTFANHYAHGNPDEGTLSLDASLFHKGSNTIAVEVHNESLRSSDILWEASIRMTATSAQDYYSTDAEIALPEGENIVLTASYRNLSKSERAKQGINAVRINEVSGSNDSYINEYQKKSDWVELYNTTDEAVDIEGMYLTDDLSNPEKCKLSKGNTNAKTIIPAHGHLIIWCDKQPTTDQALHASFKISGDGGVLALKAANKQWTDVLYYGAHDANTTVGRYPDGAADIYSMNVTTIAKPNIMSSYAELTNQEELKKATSVEHTFIAAANGFRIRYGAQQLLVKNEDDGIATIDIYTTDGRLVEHTATMVKGGSALVSVAHLPQGFYVARATDAEGNRVGCKFMK
ncbi:CotH kinase family protein [Prevotella sp. E13-27]|uniref:CotH kinase family protein n=1 Tax=Prevotella sp. E13-27 TaxID=2938122 RepID=UPI00200B7460|nr:CotH kinase family protein [Prevotella sp. E13-27]MCK8622292.1 CotH kinase family protein [Prevotella sp. E13-27]